MPKLQCDLCGWYLVLTMGELPPCPHCAGMAWSSVDDPRKPYRLSERDRELLKSLRVLAEV